MKLRQTIPGIMLFLLLCACSKSKLAPAEYLGYVEDEGNGLKVSKTIGDIKYAALYKPLDYIRLKEGGKNLSEENGLQYISLRYTLKRNGEDILKYQLDGPAAYYERVNYFAFGFQDDIRLVDGNDTLKCVLFNYVRSYGLSPAADFVLAFDNKNKTLQDKQLLIDDKVFGGGMIKIKFEKNDLEHIPELTAN